MLKIRIKYLGVFLVLISLLSFLNILYSYYFNLYLNLNSLSELFKDQTFLLMFWVHFISINLFTGSWIVKDSQRFSINKILLIIPLIVTYLIGPLGLLLYWLIRMFHAKNISLYD